MQFLHTMIRVTDLDRSIAFYTTVMGMTHIRSKENEKYKYTNAFLQFGNGTNAPQLELTYNWGNHTYDMGTAFGHIAFGVTDIHKICEKITQKGGKITRPPGPVKGGTTIIAFIADPDGYQIELVQVEG